MSAQYTNLDAAEHVERRFSSKYLQIYVPVREFLSGRIIAVAEIHEMPGLLDQRLFDVRLLSWLTTAGVTLLVMLSLFGIVYHASKLVERQQASLRHRIEEVKVVSDQNRRLREKGEPASSRLAELNASYLRHVGAELHDGPARLVGAGSPEGRTCPPGKDSGYPEKGVCWVRIACWPTLSATFGRLES